ncbi:4-hydroxybenzoate octaprenyltransferase [Marinihelvus fidelis]|uniref:4-hydroxybenzoate octaprenyltransferase n=1 Tax=Marinihelvus fidelis TaxID=2613842 RepID=A0A5N0T9G1_9GAMM|nr:4-hydroxybenzoate octaprenyltransferase [Marinihelvus fidelis]KAA9131368.1 4-hydroxybenzoate octaprenyltransferase [Marinihelvus fidelis]
MSDVREQAAASRWNACWRLMRFDRPIGILLLLWPTWWALWLAGAGDPSWANIAIFTAGVVLMRAAGCVANDLADRDFDPHVERTRNRPLAAGELRVRDAVVLLAVLMALAFVLVLFTNRMTVLLAFAGAALALTYPLFKRFTHLPQVVLGVAFGWGIPMAFTAETQTLPAVAWWLLTINTVWAVIYDTEYAMVDRDDDLAIGVKSTAILFGRADRLVIGVLMALMIAMLVVLGVAYTLSWPWFAGIGVVAAMFARQLWWIRDRERQACFRAFLDNNRVGLVIYAGLVLHYTLP